MASCMLAQFDQSEQRRNDPLLSFDEISPLFLRNEFDLFRICHVITVQTNRISPEKGKQYEMKFLEFYTRILKFLRKKG